MPVKSKFKNLSAAHKRKGAGFVDNSNENDIIRKSERKYFWLLLIGSTRLFLCTAFYLIYNSKLFDDFEKLIELYHTFEIIMLPTVLCVFLPLIFVERDRFNAINNQKRFVVCTLVWIAATFVQIKFIQLGF